MSRTITLRCKLFPERQVVIFQTLLQKYVEDDGDTHINEITCKICESGQKLEKFNWCYTKCQHLIQCNECSDYQIEKLYRCPNCCKDIIGSFPPFCASTCSRKKQTEGVLCQICQNSIRKGCSTCKNTFTFKQTRQILRDVVVVLVRNPNSLSKEFLRPCSHYSMCRICSVNICKARKKSAICPSCREFHEKEQTTTQLPTQTKSTAKKAYDIEKQAQLSANLKHCLSYTYDVPSTTIIAPTEMGKDKSFVPDLGQIRLSQTIEKNLIV